jgi:hypothetical protein
MISEKMAWRIRDLSSQGYTQSAIAGNLQVSRSTVRRVVHGSWKPRRFQHGQTLRLLELWDQATALLSGNLVGQCRACGEPVHLPCVSCLAGLLDLSGVRTPAKFRAEDCVCGGNFLRPSQATATRPPFTRQERG